MIMTGLEFAGDDSLPRRLRPLGDPGPRRPADVEEPRHRDRPAGGDRRPRRRRAALRPAGDVLDPGRPLLRRQGRAGPRPGQQALERQPADPAERRPRSSRRRGRPRVEDRWILSRLERTIASVTEKLEAYDFAHAVAGGLLVLLVASSATGTWRSSSRASTTARRRSRRRCSTRSSGCWRCCTRSMPFVTEEIWSYHPARRGAPRGAPVPGGRRVADRRGRRGGRRGRDRADPAAARLARSGRCPGRGHAARRRSTGSSRREFVGRLARFEFDGVGGEPVASVGPVAGARLATQLDAAAVAERLEKRREELRAEVERGERKLANEGFVAKAPAEVVEEERGKLERYRAELEELASRSSTPRTSTRTPTSTRWSRSAGGSASSGCTG